MEERPEAKEADRDRQIAGQSWVEVMDEYAMEYSDEKLLDKIREFAVRRMAHTGRLVIVVLSFAATLGGGCAWLSQEGGGAGSVAKGVVPCAQDSTIYTNNGPDMTITITVHDDCPEGVSSLRIFDKTDEPIFNAAIRDYPWVRQRPLPAGGYVVLMCRGVEGGDNCSFSITSP